MLILVLEMISEKRKTQEEAEYDYHRGYGDTD